MAGRLCLVTLWLYGKDRIILSIIAIIIIAALVVIDQLTKLYALNVIKPQGFVKVIDNFYYFTYVENRGAAFGMLQNKQWFFIAVTVVILGVLIGVLVKYKIEGKLFYTAVVLVFAGGIGNLIDRVFRGYVVDFLQFSFFPPVCNLADYYITVGAVMLVISVAFCKKNIAPRKVKAEE